MTSPNFWNLLTPPPQTKKPFRKFGVLLYPPPLLRRHIWRSVLASALKINHKPSGFKKTSECNVHGSSEGEWHLTEGECVRGISQQQKERKREGVN